MQHLYTGGGLKVFLFISKEGYPLSTIQSVLRFYSISQRTLSRVRSFNKYDRRLIMRQLIGLTLPELFFYKFTLGVMPEGETIWYRIQSKTECSTTGDGLIQSGIPVQELFIQTLLFHRIKFFFGLTNAVLQYLFKIKFT